MQKFLQVAVIGLLTVVFSNLLRKNSKELAILLSLVACCVIAAALVELVQPLIAFMEKLRNFTELDRHLMAPMLKCIGIGMLTQISSGICADAGESAIAKLIEICGSAFALYVSLPLLEAVLDMIGSIGGGG